MSDEFDIYLQGLKERDERTEALQTSLSQAATVNPGEFAKLKQLSEAASMDVSAVEDYKDVAKQAYLFGQANIDQMIEQSPYTAEFLSNTDNAKLGSTSIPNLTTSEKALKFIGDLGKDFQAGISMANAGAVGSVRAVLDTAVGLGDQVNTFTGLQSSGVVEKAAGLAKAWQDYYNAEATRMAPTPTDDISAGIHSGVQSFTSNVIKLPLLLASGPAGESAYMASMLTEVFGQEYDKAQDAGVGALQSVLHAGEQTAFEYLTEKTPVGMLLKDLKVGTPFFKTLRHQLISESIGEQAATLFQDFDDWANLQPNRAFSEYLKERGPAALQTFIATAVAVGGMTSVATAIQKTANSVAKRDRSKKAQRLNEELLKAVDSAELTKIAPRAMADFLNKAAAGSDATTVFFDPEQLTEALNQKGITLEQLRVDFPDIADQLENNPAQQDVAVPIGTYYAQMAPVLGDQLNQHVKYGPDQFSLFDTPEVERDAKQIEQQAAQQAEQAATQEQVFRQSSQELEAALKERFSQVNDVVADPKGAGTVAKFVTEAFSSVARQTGQLPMDIFKQFELQMVRKANRKRAGVLNQNGLDDEVPDFIEVNGEQKPTEDSEGYVIDSDETTITNFWNWFGSSVLVKDGKPIPFYHHGAFREQEDGVPSEYFHMGTQKAAQDRAAAVEMSRRQAAVEVVPDGKGKWKWVLENGDESDYVFDTKREALTKGQVQELANFKDDVSAGRLSTSDLGYMTTGYVRMENPLIVTEDPGDDWSGVIAEAERQGRDGIIYQNMFEDPGSMSVIVFTPNQIKSVNNIGTYSESDYVLSQQDRAAYDPERLVIMLYKKADFSSIVHELGHFFLDMHMALASQANVPEGIVRDMETVLKWFGVESIEQWKTLSLEAKRPFHEQFAYNWERYIFEGQAPTRELTSVFQRFTQWIKGVYANVLSDLNSIYRKQFGKDLPALTPEVRQVFDTMLGAERQYEQAEALYGMPNFDVKPDGMADATWAAYQQLVADARNMGIEKLTQEALRQLKWYGRAQSRVLRELKGEAKEKRDKILAEVTAEVKAEPVYVLINFLKTGEFPGGTAQMVDNHKLNLEAVKALYPEGKTLYPAPNYRKLGFGSHGMLSKGKGINPDQLAELFKPVYPSHPMFGSGDALVRHLVDARKIGDEIEARTDERMIREHSDLLDAESIDLKIREALHNEMTAKLVAAELRFLSGTVKPVKSILLAARAVAERQLMNLKVKDLKPRNFSVTAQKSAKAALKAAGKGQQMEAAKFKQNQLLQSEMARMGADMVAKFRVWQKKVRKFKRDSFHKSVGADAAEQVRYLLARFGLGPDVVVPEKTLTEHLSALHDEGFYIATTMDMLDEGFSVSFDQLRVDQLKDLMTLVDKLAYVGKKIREMERSDAIESTNAIAASLTESINERVDRSATVTAVQTKMEHYKAWAKQFHWSHITMATIARLLDGGKSDGPVWNALVRPANNHGNREVSQRMELDAFLKETFQPIFDKLIQKENAFTDQKVFIKELLGSKYFPDGSLTKNTMYAILLNYGNEGNAIRMRLSEGWTDAQIQAVLSHFTEVELLAAQKIGDYFEKFKSEVARIERKMHGKEPEWVAPRPFTVTSADGKQVSLRGWYYPIRYDQNRRGSTTWTESAAKLFAKGEYTDIRLDPVTRHGYTKPRAEEISNPQPLLLDTSVIFTGMNEVIHDINWREFLYDASHLVERDNFKHAVESHYGSAVYEEILKWLDDIAVGQQSASTPLERGIAMATTNVAFSRMAWNLMTAALQPLGFTQSIVRLGDGNVTEGARLFLRGLNEFRRGFDLKVYNSRINIPLPTNKAYTMALHKSSLLRNRAEATMLRELDELRNEFRGESKVRKWILTHGFFMIAKMQSFLDAITWLGKYWDSRYIVGEEKAIELADQVVIDSQGSGMTKDLPRVMRDRGFTRLLTAFYSYPNTTLNLMTVSANTTKSVANRMAEFTLLTVVTVALEQSVRALLKGGDGDDDKDWKEKSLLFIANVIEFNLNTYTGAREVSALPHELLGTGEGFMYKGPGRMATPGDILNLAKQVGQGEFDKALVKAVINVAGDLGGVPSSQLNRLIDAIDADDLEGAEVPQAVMFGVEK